MTKSQNPNSIQVTREEILSGAVQEAAASRADMKTLSEEELESSIKNTIDECPNEGDVWVFGYGSLIWNPAIRYKEQRIGRIHGWHRAFCLCTTLSRGSPEYPGLILGLDEGGYCDGVLYCIDGKHVHEEFRVLWKREMSDASYIPRWILADTDQGSIEAMSYIMDRGHPRYRGNLTLDETAEIISNAIGKMGTGVDYLKNTISSLGASDINDEYLNELENLVNLKLEIKRRIT